MDCVCAFTWSDAAAWVGALASAGAIWAAFVLYKRSKDDQRDDLQRSKDDQRDDLQKRRRTLNGLLYRNLASCANVLVYLRKVAPPVKDNLDYEGLIKFSNDIWAQLNIDRLLEVQEKLLEYGEPDDPSIALFIETLRLVKPQVDAAVANRESPAKNMYSTIARHNQSVLEEWKKLPPSVIDTVKALAGPAFISWTREGK